MDSTESYLWVSGPEWPVPPGRVTRIESRSSSTACLVFQGAVPAALCLHCQLEFLIKLDSSGDSVHTAHRGGGGRRSGGCSTPYWRGSVAAPQH